MNYVRLLNDIREDMLRGENVSEKYWEKEDGDYELTLEQYEKVLEYLYRKKDMIKYFDYAFAHPDLLHALDHKIQREAGLI